MGRRPRPALRRGRGDAGGDAARPRDARPERPALRRGRDGARRKRRADQPQRRALRAVQLLPARLPDRRQAGRPTSPTCRAPSPRARASGPACRSSASSPRTGARPGSPAEPGFRRPGRRSSRGTAGPPAGRDWRVRAKAVISAGGAFGTPELLLRSGISHPALGRHLHIHPAAWIGARYEEEVRGWEGVMQSYYVDQWQPQGILLEATFTPLSFGAQWLPGVGAAFSDRVAHFGNIASIGVHLHDRSEGRVGLTSQRLAAASPTACSRRRRARSSSGSRGRRRCTSRRARPRSIRTSVRSRSYRVASSPSSSR